MTQRKKKLIFIQISLLLLGLIIAYFTYYNKNLDSKKEIIRENVQKKISEELKKEELREDGNVFFNIEYSGFDLVGNRYILKSEEARTNSNNAELIRMKRINAIFYFKDNSVLYIWSDIGLYNNKTLDMEFEKNVKAIYKNNQLYAGKANYSNSKSFLIISENVKIDSAEGNLVADELIFDIKDQNLDIASYKDNKINAKVKLK